MLLGRTAEVEQLAGILEQARAGSSAALVICGDAGVGKTDLLKAMVSLSDDFQVVRVDGVESEVQLGYAALHRIVLPFLDRIGYLPAPQREALESAFGIRASGPPDRFLVGLAALALLGDIERTSPLLVVVDDAHWLDPDSLIALACVGRRLQGDRMALVCAVREALTEPSAFEGWQELAIEGLDEVSARELLVSLAETPVHRRVSAELIVAAKGNPLALRGFLQELNPSQLAGMTSLPDPLPTGQLIEARFARQVEGLSKETRMALLLVAAEPSGDPVKIGLAAESMGISLASLESAESQLLIRTHPAIQFSHPLVRSAVYSSASMARRREVHRALAAASDPRLENEQWAMHRALAAVGPDEDVAIALEESAIQARERGRYSTETALLVRAAELTPEPLQRSRRTLTAAFTALRASHLPSAIKLLEQSRAAGLDEMGLAQAQLLEGMICVTESPGRGPVLLQQAAEAFAPLDPGESRRALLAAFLALTAALHVAEDTNGHDLGIIALASLEEVKDDSTTDIFLESIASAFALDFGEAVPSLRRGVAHFDQMSPQELTDWYYIATFIANELWDSAAFHNVTVRLERAARQQGAVLALQHALLMMGMKATWEGRFSAAEAHYAELEDITRIGGYINMNVGTLLNVELDAWRGNEEIARAKISSLLEIGTAIGAGSIILSAHLATANLELGLGNYPAALEAAQALNAPNMPSWSCWALPLLIEAAVRCNEEAIAKAALLEVEVRAAILQTPWALGINSLGQALTGGRSDTVASSYEEAIECFEQMHWLPLVGRAHLLYGEWLRREKRRAEAQDHLRKAYELFESIGAKAFAERSRIELQAIGIRTKRRTEDKAFDLTARELQVARLAATRLTTREIASQLFISPHTVEYHLRKVFQKLGVRSRRDLGTAIQQLGLDAA